MKYSDIFSPETMEKLNQQSIENFQILSRGRGVNGMMRDGMQLLNQVIQIESPHIPHLEKLAVDIVNNIYPIIKDNNITIDAKITSLQDVNNSIDDEFDDDDDETPEFEEDEKEKYSDELAARRVVNGITQGASLRNTFVFYLFKEHLDGISPSLVDSYNNLMKDVYGVYDDDNAIAMMLMMLSQNSKMAGGSSKIKLPDNHGEEDELDDIKLDLGDLDIAMPEPTPESNSTTIVARAICFPMLVHEIIKGLYELISLYNFKGDKEQNQKVANTVDKLENEPEDLRYGKFIYDKLNNIFVDSQYDDPRIREYFLQEIYSLEDKDFLSIIEGIINNKINSKQKSWISDVLRDIQYDLNKDDIDTLDNN